VFLNAADEIAVEAFLERRIRFTDIARVLEVSLERLGATPVTSVEDVLAADAEARVVARQAVSEATT
jgi:1-deoxy-D-xylulose-5-phosphate reductoisomerase